MKGCLRFAGMIVGGFVALMVVLVVIAALSGEKPKAKPAAATSSPLNAVGAPVAEPVKVPQVRAPEPEPAPKNPLAEVSIVALRKRFEASGFRFTSDELKDGTPRVIGEGPSKLCTIELIGGAALDRINVLIGVVKGNVNGEATAALMHLMQQTGGFEAFRAILTAAEQGKKTTETVGGVEYELNPMAGGMTLLVIRPAAAK